MCRNFIWSSHFFSVQHLDPSLILENYFPNYILLESNENKKQKTGVFQYLFR